MGLIYACIIYVIATPISYALNSIYNKNRDNLVAIAIMWPIRAVANALNIIAALVSLLYVGLSGDDQFLEDD